MNIISDTPVFYLQVSLDQDPFLITAPTQMVVISSRQCWTAMQNSICMKENLHGENLHEEPLILKWKIYQDL